MYRPASQTYLSETMNAASWNSLNSQAPLAQGFQSPKLGSMSFDQDSGWPLPRTDPSPGILPNPRWSAQTQMWYYLDTTNTVQGPFPATSMQMWFDQKYLFPELLIRAEEDATFRPLHVYMADSSDPLRFFLIPPKNFMMTASVTPTPPRIPSVIGSPHVSASPSPQLGAMPLPQREASVRAVPDSMAANSKTSPLAASNLSADDILTSLRVMSQLQTLLPNSTEAQTLQMLRTVLSSSVPHANEAGMQDILHAMQQQAHDDAMRATQAQAYADAGTSISTPEAAPVKSAPLHHSNTLWTNNKDLYSDEDDPFSLEPLRTDDVVSKQDDEQLEPSLRPKPVPIESKPIAHEELPAKTSEAPAEPTKKAAPSTLPKSSTTGRPAPWAATTNKPANASKPNMREILEAEQREHKAREARERANNSAMLAQAMASMQVSRPDSSAQPSRPSRQSSGSAWSVPKPVPAKSLSEIQQEESARTASEKAAQAARPSAYSNSVVRGSLGEAPSFTTSEASDDGWVKIGANGKGQHPLPSKPVLAKSSVPPKPTSAVPLRTAALPTRPPALASPMLSSGQSGPSVASEADEEGWVTMKPKHQVRRDALSQMNDAIPRPSTTSVGVTSRPTVVPSTPQPPSPEFLKHCREQLKGLRANIDDFIEMLLSFPLNPSADVSDIIAEAVYANSSTLDGRRFAADFISRRKADAYRAVTI